eukprot:1160914-Pelagomonas_calceolata.AAC.18
MACLLLWPKTQKGRMAMSFAFELYVVLEQRAEGFPELETIGGKQQGHCTPFTACIGLGTPHQMAL